MSQNLKDLIDKAEEEERTRAQLEKNVENLKLKVARLETKLKETRESQEPVFQNVPTGEAESEEILLLKNLINSQNQELTQRNREKEVLQIKVENLNNELVNLKESMNDSIKDQVIMKTQNSLNTLIEDYGRLENMNKNLKEKILEIESENDRLRENMKIGDKETSHIEELEYKMSRLNKQLNDLREANKLLENSNLVLKDKELSVENLENTLENLESINIELKKENQQLSVKLEEVKAERFRLTRFEAKVSSLEKEVKKLQVENEDLKQKDAILLAKTINLMETQKKESPRMEEFHIPKKKGLEKELKVEAREEDLSIESSEIVEELTTEGEKLKDEMSKEESITRKKTCPNCGNTNKDQIREFDDKTKILYTYPRIYGKMYRCGQCGTEWR
jgi:DNA repair exonuclease SbcCD ATPase subunit